jgi:hypothetical protein
MVSLGGDYCNNPWLAHNLVEYALETPISLSIRCLSVLVAGMLLCLALLACGKTGPLYLPNDAPTPTPAAD